jgi:DNA invertase Pin-like site-specific DNA recombinase
MTSAELLPAAVLKRKAVVYIRQSTQAQVQTNLESQRRQYELVDVARQRGFHDIEVIDDDLGRSASGMVARPGFERLVAWLCAREVGAVLCFDASRLARNGRDWHHLLELCGLVEARVIDLDGVYDPCRPNDRLLLGMKGSISEFELGVLRARMLDAARAKAQRGELRISVPIGYLWHREIGQGFDPDLRIQEVVRLIFARFRQLGSARQVFSVTARRAGPFPAAFGRQGPEVQILSLRPTFQPHFPRISVSASCPKSRNTTRTSAIRWHQADTDVSELFGYKSGSCVLGLATRRSVFPGRGNGSADGRILDAHRASIRPGREGRYMAHVTLYTRERDGAGLTITDVCRVKGAVRLRIAAEGEVWEYPIKDVGPPTLKHEKVRPLPGRAETPLTNC